MLLVEPLDGFLELLGLLDVARGVVQPRLHRPQLHLEGVAELPLLHHLLGGGVETQLVVGHGKLQGLVLAAKFTQLCLHLQKCMVYSETSNKGHSERGQTSEQRTNQKYSSTLVYYTLYAEY